MNASVGWAEWDEELLGLELLELKNVDFDLGLTGFENTELDRYLSAITLGEGLTDEDAAPELPESPISKPGDLWILGRHRVLCGDATKMTDVELLLHSEKADLIFTDPPYNVDYQGYTKDKLKIASDRMLETDFGQLLRSAFANYRKQILGQADQITVQNNLQIAVLVPASTEEPHVLQIEGTR